MSEYQYYEFQAVDRPLTGRQMTELRKVSTRATITSTRFTNHYQWGDFKGNPSKWMEKYFDAFLYVANWGTHEFMLRFPRRVLDLETAKRYCRGESAKARVKGDFVILEFRSGDEDGDSWEGNDDGSGWVSSLISLRRDIAAGDHRALYLAWLFCVQNREVKDRETEPPVPPVRSELRRRFQRAQSVGDADASRKPRTVRELLNKFERHAGGKGKSSRAETE